MKAGNVLKAEIDSEDEDDSIPIMELVHLMQAATLKLKIQNPVNARYWIKRRKTVELSEI